MVCLHTQKQSAEGNARTNVQRMAAAAAASLSQEPLEHGKCTPHLANAELHYRTFNYKGCHSAHHRGALRYVSNDCATLRTQG